MHESLEIDCKVENDSRCETLMRQKQIQIKLQKTNYKMSTTERQHLPCSLSQLQLIVIRDVVIRE